MLSAASIRPPPTDVVPVEAARAWLSRLTRSGPLVLAISGGGDSVAMLRAFALAHEQTASPCTQLVAATVDHRLRRDSTAEAAWVAGLCGRLGIAHHTLCWQGPAPPSGLQEAARLARYGLLATLARQIGAVGIVTAHTSDDQAETITMRAARARTGPEAMPHAGLAGIAPAMLYERRIWVMRPLLDLNRATLRRWLIAIGQGWLDDPSNADRRFERVRVRLDMGPDPDRARKVAAVAAGDRAGLARRVADWLAARADFGSGLVATVDLEELGESDEMLPAESVRWLIAMVGGLSRPPSAAAVTRALAACQAPGRGASLGRVVMARRGQRLFCRRERRGLAGGHVPCGDVGAWDGRYLIDNRAGDAPLAIQVPEPGQIAAAPSGRSDRPVPAGLLRAGLAADALLDGQGPAGACQWLFDATGRGRDIDARWFVERALPAHDRFLPLFDRAIAARIAALVGRAPYPTPPVDIEDVN